MTTEQPYISKHLIEGAKTIIKTIEKPGFLLGFLTQALETVHLHVIKHNLKGDADCHYYTSRLIDNIVWPWISGGKVVEGIAEGLQNLYSLDFYDGYERCMTSLLEALAEAEPEDPGENLLFIEALYKLGCYIRAHHEEEEKKRVN